MDGQSEFYLKTGKIKENEKVWIKYKRENFHFQNKIIFVDIQDKKESIFNEQREYNFFIFIIMKLVVFCVDILTVYSYLLIPSYKISLISF